MDHCENFMDSFSTQDTGFGMGQVGKASGEKKQWHSHSVPENGLTSGFLTSMIPLCVLQHILFACMFVCLFMCKVGSLPIVGLELVNLRATRSTN